MVSSANSSYDDELKTNTCKSMSARKKVSTPSKTSYPYYILACVVMLCVGLGITYFFLQNNVASAQEYPIKGFDVSHHQGDIQWQSISPQEFKFVYLKATEGAISKTVNFRTIGSKLVNKAFWSGLIIFIVYAVMARFRRRTLSKLCRRKPIVCRL
jgi:lysozyme